MIYNYKKTGVLFLLSLTFLFQSCFSCREMKKNSDNLKVGEKYKVQVGSKNYIGNLVSFNDSEIKIKKGKIENEIKILEINKIKNRKFIILKTLGYSTGILVVIIAVFSVRNNPSIPVGNSPN